MRDALIMALARHAGETVTPQLARALLDELFPDRTIDPAQFPQEEHDGYTIQAEHFHEVLSELIPLHAAHWQETERHRHGLALNPRYDRMQERFRAGCGIQFTVRKEGVLAGHLRLWLFESEHTSTPAAEEDTLYLLPGHRGGYLAIHLLRYAERCLHHLKGAIEIRTNSKLVNRADVLMRRMRYEPFAMQFVKFLPAMPPTSPQE